MSAKDITLRPIKAEVARKLVKKLHYSGKVSNTSCLHFGVFYKGKLEGAMQFGSPIDKRRVLPLVKDTKWNGFLELNRMAFSENLPRNSESRAISVALKLIKKNYPHIEWILSYADATQCGDGIIYRASGFYLTGIKDNTTMLRLPSGEIVADITLNVSIQKKALKKVAEKLPGFQIRYIYFINKEAKKRLSVPILSYKKLVEKGAKMYKGKKISVASETGDTTSIHEVKGGSNPTAMLQFAKE